MALHRGGQTRKSGMGEDGPMDCCLRCVGLFMFGYFNGRDFEGIYIIKGRVNEDKDLKIQRVERS